MNCYGFSIFFFLNGHPVSNALSEIELLINKGSEQLFR